MAIGFDPLLLSNYYAAKLPLARSQIDALSARTQTALPPWDISIKKPAQEKQDVTARSSDPYFDPKDPLLRPSGSAAGNADSQLAALLATRLSPSSSTSNSALAADNDRLFALYKALDRLDYIAKMATRDGTLDGQRPGLDRSFQDGLSQILDFVATAPFDKLTMLASQKTSTAQSAVTIAYPKSSYEGGSVVADGKVLDAVPGVSATDRFTISVTKAGVTTDVVIDLANVTGTLNVDNINSYINQQLSAAGFATRFARQQTGGSILDRTATWGVKVDMRPGETISMSSTEATASVYIAGMTGKVGESQGRLLKLAGLDGTPSSKFAANIAPESGAASAKATAVDANGNVYVIGNTTGSFGSEINQAKEDVFLTKYDSAGNVQWTKLLGTADQASGYGIAVDPLSGGVVIAGAVTGDLVPTAVGSGTDSFVVKYDAAGNQKWLRQVAPSTNDQANAVSVDASGNVYLGGQTLGIIGSGQTNSGGADAYVTKLDKNGVLQFHRQFGTTSSDAAMRTAIADDGNLLVASVENGHGYLTKYGAADGTSAAMWRIDLGDLQGGTIGGLTVAGGQVYVSGNTANGALNAAVANASAGGTEAFVFAAADNGASASADFVTYAGTGSAEQGGGVAVANGKIYLTGSTTGTFAGQTRAVENVHNLFVAQFDADGSFNWAQQYGGRDGTSRGLAIAADDAGASVLDALKLPRGTLEITQSNAIESQTTARAGDYFTLKIEGRTSERTVKITIAKGETLRSLALKINGALLFDGKATALPVKGGQGLKIAVNEGVRVSLIAGPKDFDALKGLGLKPQMLSNDGTADESSDAADTKSAEPEVIGLGIDGKLDLLTKEAAGHVHVVMQAAMALIKQAYNNLNGAGDAGAAQISGQVPAYLQRQMAGYQTALAWLNTIK